MKTLTGISISAGYAEGPIFVFSPNVFQAPPRQAITTREVQKNLRAIREAFQRTSVDLNALQERLAADFEDAAASHIFHAHLHLLSDPVWISGIERKIEKGHIAAHCALHEVTEKLALQFEGMENSYLAAKATDLRDVERRVMAHLLPERVQALSHLSEPSIVVARSLMPSEVINLDRENTLAIITEEGGVADHVSVVTRSLGIPGLTQVKGVTHRVRSGQRAIVDGVTAKLLVSITSSAHRRYEELRGGWNAERQQLMLLREVPALTTDGKRITLSANIGDESDAKKANEAGAEGIGLLRTELAFLKSARHPTEAQQLAAYRAMAKHLDGLPLTIRTLDLGGDKFLGYEMSGQREQNPLLGRRGVRRSLEEPKIFRRQIRALMRLAAEQDVRLLLPMVVSVSDIVRVREQIAISASELERSGHPHRYNIPIGVMVETPASVIIIEDLLPNTDFVNVGTNDLIQYMLVVDRADGRLMEHYSLFHPAVLRSLHQVASACRSANKPLCLCGELAGLVKMTALLVGLGFDHLSVAPGEIPVIKREIRTIDTQQALDLAESTLKMSLRGSIESTVLSQR